MIEPARRSVIAGATARMPRNTPDQVDLDDAPEVLQRGLGERRRQEHAGVVEQDVDAPVRVAAPQRPPPASRPRS